MLRTEVRMPLPIVRVARPPDYAELETRFCHVQRDFVTRSFSITQPAHDDGTFGAVDGTLELDLSAEVRIIQIDAGPRSAILHCLEPVPWRCNAAGVCWHHVQGGCVYGAQGVGALRGVVMVHAVR
jgi:hypothetical protein